MRQDQKTGGTRMGVGVFKARRRRGPHLHLLRDKPW
jgi:hypothetical protein